ncbi:MAG: protein translocase subunit SecD [Planctomycetota bacterium]|jgi:SecD/SecF fusion protein|nr:protein translocase subunit SecD [Planctomycetota bacterium]
MNEKLKNRFIVIGLVFLFSLLFIWPPFADPPLVTRDVVRMYGVEGNYLNKILDWETGKPMVRQVDILSTDDDHTKEVHDSEWYAWFIRRRYDATPEDKDGMPQGGRVVWGPEELDFELPNGNKLKRMVKKVRFRQVLRVRHTLNLGLDLSGGTELVYQVQPRESEEDKEQGIGAVDRRSRQTEQIVDIIKRRINITGLKEPRIQAQGTDRILIQIPGKDKAQVESIKSIIQTSGHLEFRVVNDNEATKKEALSGVVPPGHKLYDFERDPESGDVEKLLVVTPDDYNVTGADLSRAYPTQDDNNLPAVGFNFKAGRGRKFGRMTQEHLQERICIILDGVVFSAPNVQSRIDNNGIINGKFSYDEAKNLATILSAGSLPADLKLEMENEVSPFIGDDSISNGLWAILIGGIVVFVTMAAYYMQSGLIANIALTFNILILLGSLAMFHATLTLPGIAGILLTVGMAVDANVLVFERMREERLKRDSFFKSIESGYDNAFRTILDANVTTLITAGILIYIGTGPVRGFGITLAIGILASLFTAIYVTRSIFTLLVEKEVMKEAKMMELKFVRDAAYDFLRHDRKALTVSVAIILIGLVLFFSRGSDNFDIDFKGGYLIHIKLSEPVKTEAIRKLVEAADLRKPEVQQYGEAGPEGSTDFVIRTEKDYGYTIEGGAPKRSGADKYSARLIFNDAVDAKIVQDRLTAAAQLTNVQVAGEEKALNVTLTSDISDAQEVSRIMGQSLNDLPKYDLLRVPGINALLLPEAFEKNDEAMFVNFGQGINAAGLEEELLRQLLDGVAVEGVAGTEGAHTRVKITDERKRYDTIVDMIRGYEAIAGKLSEPFQRYTKIGKAVAGDLVFKALVALVLSWVAILIYVGIRFHGIKYGAAAIVALIHDALIVLVLTSLADQLELVDGKINLTMIAAMLTIIGYSVNDTIVIFDRIRENVQNSNKPSEYTNLVNLSNNQMLARTLMTSGLTLVALLSLFIFGGGQIQGFAFAMILGVLVGTYSSIFVACPLVVHWETWFAEDKGSKKS